MLGRALCRFSRLIGIQIGFFARNAWRCSSITLPHMSMPHRRSSYQIAAAPPTAAGARDGEEHAAATRAAQINRHTFGDIHASRCEEGRPRAPLPLLSRLQPTRWAVEMQFPMWLVPLHHFLGLTELLPHQTLRRLNKIVRHSPMMKTVIFVSHQWTAFNQPDHTGRQLRTLQRMLQRMMAGDVPAVDAPFIDQASRTCKHGGDKPRPGPSSCASEHVQNVQNRVHEIHLLLLKKTSTRQKPLRRGAL